MQPVIKNSLTSCLEELLQVGLGWVCGTMYGVGVTKESLCIQLLQAFAGFMHFLLPCKLCRSTEGNTFNITEHCCGKLFPICTCLTFTMNTIKVTLFTAMHKSSHIGGAYCRFLCG